MMICAIICFLAEYPLAQCFGIIFTNLSMLFYLIVFKPFKEEN